MLWCVLFGSVLFGFNWCCCVISCNVVFFGIVLVGAYALHEMHAMHAVYVIHAILVTYEMYIYIYNIVYIYVLSCHVMS